MAVPYAEGEVYFKRSALKDERTGWWLGSQKTFYDFCLIETVWTVPYQVGRPGSHTPDINRPRAYLTHQTAHESYKWCYFHWDRFEVSFGPNFDGTGITQKCILNNCPGGDSYRDKNSGGPAKVVIRPCFMPRAKCMFVDLNVPIRAIYLPLTFQTDEAFPDLCTYLMIDFRMRDGVTMLQTGGNQPTSYLG